MACLPIANNQIVVCQGSPTYGPIQQWWLWVSIAIMFADQIVGMLMQYKSIASAFSLARFLPPRWRWNIRRTSSPGTVNAFY
jgi:hypothetical protein